LVSLCRSDIYGGDYNAFNLKAGTVASAFGKMVMKEKPSEDVTNADIAAAYVP
jgi:pantothenate kinase